MHLDDAARQLKFTISEAKGESDRCSGNHVFSFDEMHQKLVEKTEQFFLSANSTPEENSTIFLIKDYISQKYMNETLSVKDISDHVFLSASYVCTFFKNETGQTLNQYLTEYRMEKAKQLLVRSQIQNFRYFCTGLVTVMEIILAKALRNTPGFPRLNTVKKRAEKGA